MSDVALVSPRLFAARRFGGINPLSILVLLIVATALVATGSKLLCDPDTQWHIAVGRQIWANAAVPTTDTYSYTFAGSPWIAKEWVSQLLLAGADALGGWRGVVLVTAAAIGAAFALLFGYLSRWLRLPVAAALTLIAFVMAWPHLLARPHMLVLPVIVAWTTGLLSAGDHGKAPPLRMAALMTLWVNMHGSFPLGLVLAGVLAVEAAVAAPPAVRKATSINWGLFLAAATGATFVSPYGLAAILVPLRMEGNAETLKYVREWVPLGFGPLGIFAGIVAVACIVVLLPRWRANLFRLVLVGVLAALMERHVRFVSLFCMIALPLVAAALASWPRLAASGRKPPAALWGTVAALAAVSLVTVAMSQPLPDLRMTPEAAYQAARDAGVEGPVLNTYDFGGFLIAHGIKTFVDGRTDQLFLGSFLPDYMRAVKATDDAAFAAILAKYSIAWALVRSKSDEGRHLSHLPGWTEIHADDVAEVFVRR